jgi:DNA-directed RNA polymerase specialized sigma24 family protein
VADGLEEFQEQRLRMLGIGYRMLGSVTDAEKVLQEAWLRWQGVDHSQVKDPAAFLARTVTNLCLNLLTSARSWRRLQPPGGRRPDRYDGGERAAAAFTSAQARP